MRETEGITSHVIKGVNDRNLNYIKTALYGIVISDRRLEDGILEKNIEYIEEHGIKIKEELDKNKPLLSVEKKGEYTREDFRYAAIYLSENFCDERINDVRKIGQAVYKKQVRNINPVTEKQTNNCQVQGITPVKKQMNPKVKKKRIIWGIAAAAAVIVAGIIAVATK
ncbi:hypothetical protein ACED96_05135 [Clostridium thermobutyricum]